MGQFDYRRAASAFEQLLDAQPQSADARIDLAIALLNRREGADLARSGELLDQAIAGDESNLRARYCRGLLHYHDGKIDKAREQFEYVVRADPTDGYAIYFLGQCHFASGKFGDALKSFQRAQQVDPHLRSAYYGAFQAAQRANNASLARESLQTFQKLADNPRARLAELKYTRMGSKAEVDVVRTPPTASPPPVGPLFEEPAPLSLRVETDDPIAFVVDEANPPSVTAADLNGDGLTDLFASASVRRTDGNIGNAVLVREGTGFRVDVAHPLAAVAKVRAALWGDYDNDGLVDVYLCRQGPNQLWRQATPGNWIETTAETRADGGNFDTVDGACFDADHDGDLDYFLANSDGPNELLNNDRNGVFRPVARDLGLAANARGSRGVVVADLDADDDVDIVVLRAIPPHDVYLNDRLWEYRSAENFANLCAANIRALVAADADVDGQTELYAVDDQGLTRWAPGEHGPGEHGVWAGTRVAALRDADNGPWTALAMHDFDGDSQLDCLLQQDGRLQVFSLQGVVRLELSVPTFAGCARTLVGERGTGIVVCQRAEGPLAASPGPGRHPFALVHLQGRIDKGAEMRSNASGIGVEAAARIGANWASVPAFRADSGPGQSLQPAAIGLCGADKIDFLRLVWPDGVSQSELDLLPGKLHVVAETQRQAGSCPLVFIWNGDAYEFVADILGAGGIGFNLGKGEYYEPRPEESLLLPASQLRPLAGRYVIKLGEPMEEICYFDAVRLAAYDLPTGWQMALDERFGALPPLPTGKPVFFRRELLPALAKNERGEDVTAALREADRRAAPLRRDDRRFIGLAEPHWLQLNFSEPLDALENPVLMFDGWVEYAYSQTAFAAWQAGVPFVEPTVEALASDGIWRVVADRFGYMAGTARRATVPLDRRRLPTGTRTLRLRTNMQVYWDRIAIVESEPCPPAQRVELELKKAQVADVGFSQRILLDQRCALYDYAQRPPLADARHPAGWYTEFGDAQELVAERDHALAIIGPGEELHLEFAEAEPLPAGCQRWFVLETDGWCKDADLFTKDSGTVEPLPTRAEGTTPEEQDVGSELHRRFNTRYRSGW